MKESTQKLRESLEAALNQVTALEKQGTLMQATAIAFEEILDQIERAVSKDLQVLNRNLVDMDSDEVATVVIDAVARVLRRFISIVDVEEVEEEA